MVAKAKKRWLPFCVTMLLSAILAVSGLSILGANAAVSSGDGMKEEASESSTNVGDRAYYEYNGAVQTALLQPGTWQLEVWGAQGGGGYADGTFAGGNGTAYGQGGYMKGTVTVKAPTTIYIVIGGMGANGKLGQYGGENARAAGGYNGGGPSGLEMNNDADDEGGGGGGATHIALDSGLLSTFANKKNRVLIVAGGGGGVGYKRATSAGADGDGGGTAGSPGADATAGKGGTASAGGARGAGAGPSAGHTGDGTFGKGGTGGNNSTGGGGGGGGWYGGGGGNGDGGSGGGGSGYCNPSTDVGKVTQTAATTGGRTGNGRAIITCTALAHPTPSPANNQAFFDYKGTVQSMVLEPGVWQLEVWGGQGGGGYCDGVLAGGSGSDYGKGGYTSAYYTVTQPTTVYIAVGGVGENGKLGTHNVAAGGWNGGGNSGQETNSDMNDEGGGGGGATHIALDTGLLSTFANKQNRVLVVAGGGGGTHYFRAPQSGTGGGGNGGGGNGGAGGSAGGGTQTAGGKPGGTNIPSGTEAGIAYKNATAGSFGQGGSGGSHCTGGSGGGGGWYGGAGSACACSGGGSNNYGGGGSAHVNTSLCTNAKGYNGIHTGSGYARITCLNRFPQQRVGGTTSGAVVTGGNTANSPLISISRETTLASLPLKGTSKTTSLLGVEPDGQTIQIKTAGVYLSASTSSPATAWLQYTANVGATAITGIKAKQYWSGNKTFYVHVKDVNGTTDMGGYAWFSFNATCVQGEIVAVPSRVATGKNGSGVTESGTNYSLTTDKYNLGTGNTTIATEAQSLSEGEGAKIFNPVGANRMTIWLKDPITSKKTVKLHVDDMFDKTLRAGGAAEANENLETLVFANANASSVVYGTKRYNKDSSVTAVAENVPNGNSSYYSTASLTNARNVGTAGFKGAKTVELTAIAGRPAGAYYYVVTLTVSKVCSLTGTQVMSIPLDVIYRVDNTRPALYMATAGVGPAVTVNSGSSATIALDNIARDSDGDALRITDVVVPTTEYAAVDQYGKVLSTANNYNKVLNSSGAYTALPESSFGAGTDVVTQTAQIPVSSNYNAQTGWSSDFVYNAAASGYDPTFSASVNGGASAGAYIGVYVNSARNQLTVVGNIATRYLYKDKNAATDTGTRQGHFYILVKVQDAGNTEDEGIWFPVAITVNSVAPVSANPTYSAHSLVADSSKGEVYFTPMGVQVSGKYAGLGTLSTADVTKTDYLPLASDRDTYAEKLDNNNNLRLFGGKPIPSSSGLITSFGQSEMIFLSPDSATANISLGGTTYTFKNEYLTAAGGSDYFQGWKEFFTVEKVSMYASSSVLLGLTDKQISDLLASGTIRAAGADNQFVEFDGLKVTLNKSTLDKYLNFFVNVTDTSGKTSTIRVSIRVEADGLTNADLRTINNKNLNLRPNNDDHKDGTVQQGKTGENTTEKYWYGFTIKRNEILRVSPYDLVFSRDTFNVNNGGMALNGDGTYSYKEGAYNTVPTVSGDKGYDQAYANEHKKALAGVNKDICVFASDTASGDMTARNDFRLRKLSIANTSPDTGFADTYTTVSYGGEDANAYMEHFFIRGDLKTPADGYASFNYRITSNQPGDAGVEVQIRIYVENSLPNVLPSLTNKVFYLSATPTLGNSSAEEFVNGAYVINNNTYTVREFLISELFEDADKESMQFYDSNAYVYTKNDDGEFVRIDNNRFVNAYTGYGTNQRFGKGRCLIIEGLSSTQGVKNGVYVGVRVTDETGMAPKMSYFQVEVLDSAPEYAEMAGTNSMTAELVDGDTTYVWATENAKTSNVFARAFETERNDAVYDPKEGDYTTTPDGIKSVVKPLYIVSNDRVMGYYAQALQNLGRGLTLKYAPSQVRSLAVDPDKGQGLILSTENFEQHGAAGVQDFNIGTMAASSAVSINDFYQKSNTDMINWYKYNNVVQLIFFDDEGNHINTNSTVTNDPAQAAEAAKKTNLSTNWIVAINFIDTIPDPENNLVKVSLRLRDSNGNVKIVTTSEGATAPDGEITYKQGGYTVSDERGYKGNRADAASSVQVGHGETHEGGYTVQSAKSFKFAVRMGTAGLYNTFTKWTNNNPWNGLDMTNAWVEEDESGNPVYYPFTDTSVTQDKIFKYEGLTVSSGNGVATVVPISYFAWDSNNDSSTVRSNQGSAVGFNADTFLSDAGDGNIAAVQSAIELTDGYNTWKGDTLLSNPYLNINLVAENNLAAANKFGNPSDKGVKNNYLYGQQRVDKGGKSIAVDNGSNSFFIEDRYGLSFSKKYIRSVGNLSLKLKLSRWSKSNNVWGKSKSVNIEVTVPIFVENTEIGIKPDIENGTDRVYNGITTSSDIGSYTVQLTNANSEKQGTSVVDKNLKVIESNMSDQVYDSSKPDVKPVIGSTRYSEDMYFLSGSLNGNFSQSELARIKELLENRTHTLIPSYARVGEYFGLSDSDVVQPNAVVQTAADGTTLELVKKSSNTKREYYFGVEFGSNSDTKSLTIIPKRITTFDWQTIRNKYTFSDYNADFAAFENEIEGEAAKRELSVLNWTQDKDGKPVPTFCYPLRLIVYDRLTLGSRSTSFDDASLDVITLNVQVINSAPTVVTRNGYDEDFEDGKTKGRSITLSVGDETSAIPLSYIFNDTDMVKNGTVFLRKDEIENYGDAGKPGSDITDEYEKQIVRETGDYPMEFGAAKNLVSYEFLTVEANGQTNEYTTANPNGGVSCTIQDGRSIVIAAKNRVFGVPMDKYAAMIKFTFTDRYGASVSAIIAVYIGNATPWLTDAARNTTDITLHTGDYFTLMATSWANFSKGMNKSTTLGYGGNTGVYQRDDVVNSKAAQNTTSDEFRKSYSNIQPWSYENGPMQGSNFVGWNLAEGYNMDTTPLGGTSGSEDTFDDKKWGNPDMASKNNRGYMAIANDDAPWTLRIANVSMSANGRDMISYSTHNDVPYEGVESGFFEQGNFAPTAVMFEAMGACENVEVKITVYDGQNKTDDNSQFVTYTFNITVVSTRPESITNQRNSEKLGSSLKDTIWETQNRLTHASQQSQDVKIGEYNLHMYAGEEVTLQTSDFATDKDRNDDANLWLSPWNGNSLFAINKTDDKNDYIFTNQTSHISLTTKGNKPTAFTIKADNFHNVDNAEKQYDTVYFYITDPSVNPQTQEERDNWCIKVTLHVYVYPNTMAAKSANAATIDVKSVEEYRNPDDGEAYEIPLVTSDNSGLIKDADADAALTRYNVTLYSFARYTDDEKTTVDCLNYAEFDKLSDADKEKQIVATLSFPVDNDGKISMTGTTVRNENDAAEILSTYIESITFSQNGTSVFVVPARATNNFRFLPSDDGKGAPGFYMYAVVEKAVNRGTQPPTGPAFSPTNMPNYAQNAYMAVKVKNSAPFAIGNTEHNVGIQGTKLPYLTANGGSGKHVYYYLYNNLTENDEALFRDPDADTLSLSSAKLTKVYVMQSGAEVPLTSADVLAKADAAIKVSTIDREYTFNPGEGKDPLKETYKALDFEILRKISITGYETETIYVKYEIVATDGISVSDTTTVTIGVYNTAPELVETNEIRPEFAAADKQNAYVKNIGGDAELTLTLSKDKSDKYVTQNNGLVRIGLSDLVKDADFAAGAESFVFAAVENLKIPDFSGISGNSQRYLGLTSGKTNVDYFDSEVTAKASSCDFLIHIVSGDNLLIEFIPNSYRRGVRSQVALKVRDSSGAETGILTITLVIGNSKPIDLTREPAVEGGETVDSNITLTGGVKKDTPTNTGLTDEEIAEIFTPKSYSILDYVLDHNPDDMEEYAAEPDEAKTYLRITEYSFGRIDWDYDGDDEAMKDAFSDYLGSIDVGGPQEPSSLFDFVIQSGQQSFSITPLPKLYGEQTITLTITDGGNSMAEGSESITVELTVTITQNPKQKVAKQVNIYWKRTMPITAADLYGESASTGYTVVGLRLNDPADEKYAKINSATCSITGAVKTEEGKLIDAWADIVVGAQARQYSIPFKLCIKDNLRPQLWANPTGGKYGEGVSYIPKEYFDDDGRWTVPITDIFHDEENDPLILHSASSKKSTLIDVTADTQNNALVFHFKSRGETTLTVRIEDAVGIYTYKFDIGNLDLPAPNFFIGIISRIQSNPLIFIIIACAILLLLILLIIIIAAARKKKKMREEIEALLVSEMELEEQMLRLAAGPSPTSYQSYGYLPPTQGAQQPGLMLGAGQTGADPNAAIGLNPGGQPGAAPQASDAQIPPSDGGIGDDEL